MSRIIDTLIGFYNTICIVGLYLCGIIIITKVFPDCEWWFYLLCGLGYYWIIYKIHTTSENTDKLMEMYWKWKFNNKEW